MLQRQWQKGKGAKAIAQRQWLKDIGIKAMDKGNSRKLRVQRKCNDMKEMTQSQLDKGIGSKTMV